MSTDAEMYASPRDAQLNLPALDDPSSPAVLYAFQVCKSSDRRRKSSASDFKRKYQGLLMSKGIVLKFYYIAPGYLSTEDENGEDFNILQFKSLGRPQFSKFLDTTIIKKLMEHARSEPKKSLEASNDWTAAYKRPKEL